MIESEGAAAALFGCELLPLVTRLDGRHDCKTAASFESRSTSAFVMRCEYLSNSEFVVSVMVFLCTPKSRGCPEVPGNEIHALQPSCGLVACCDLQWDTPRTAVTLIALDPIFTVISNGPAEVAILQQTVPLHAIA